MPDQPASRPRNEGHADVIHLSIDATLRRTGMGKRMVFGNEPPALDDSLIRLVARAHRIRERLHNDPSLTLRDIAAEEGVVGSYITRLLRLAYLAPDIVTAILDGKQPAGLTATRLSRWKNLPLDWAEQRRVFGFA